MTDPAREIADRMAKAARDWLDSLDPVQRALGTGPAPGADEAAEAERTTWFYTPTDHGGLTFARQAPAQYRQVMRLLSTGLSEAGYNTVAAIIGLENVLDRVEDFSILWGRERSRDPNMYYLRVFGEPGGTEPWGWRFGGHHVSLNFLVVDGRVAATTPLFLGADPASSPLLGGQTLRPLAAAEDLARELVRSLSPEAAERAILLPRPPYDVVAGNSPRVDDRILTRRQLWRPEQMVPDRADTPHTLLDDDERRAVSLKGPFKGVPGSELDAVQRELLRALLGTYLSRVAEGISPLSRYDDPARLDEVHFAWAGSTEPGEAHYYRVHGPRLLVEWTKVHRDANHAHAVWRDPDTDFGGDVLADHVAAHHAEHRTDPHAHGAH
jgi:hypothetical protein